jgi:hypothetical protein
MSNIDHFASYSAAPNSPARYAASAVLSDTENLPVSGRGLYIGGNGDVVLKTVGGNNVTFSNLVAGTILPICVMQIFSTGTTASNIIVMA